MLIKGYSHTVVGSRDVNQDAFLVEDNQGLYAVADGVGGGVKGEVASQMAVDGLRTLGSRNLKSSFHLIQDSIYNEAMSTVGEALMGTTFTAISILDNRASLCHAGDSRAYHYTKDHLRQLTEDHEFFDEGLQAPVLASYLGIPTDIHPLRIQEENFLLAPGDRLLLCSDGLYKQMAETRILSLIRLHNTDPAHLLQILCEEAARREHSDNVTIVYVTIDE